MSASRGQPVSETVRTAQVAIAHENLRLQRRDHGKPARETQLQLRRKAGRFKAPHTFRKTLP